MSGKPHDFNISIPLHHEILTCGYCGSRYPITADMIPIVWTESLRRSFSAMNKTDRAGEMDGNMCANVKIYDNISDDYHIYTRRNMDICIRMRNSVKRIFVAGGTENLLHLDFGCGPGHVLNWLEPFGFRQVGLDVSLTNLRNALKGGNRMVVCGDACNMPFKDGTFSLVTESSVLHHIYDWKSVVSESCRICARGGGIILDSEPGSMQMALSPLAVAVFNARFPVYKAASYFIKSKYIYRNEEKARLNLQAEIHHQPGTGFPLDELGGIFKASDFDAEIIVSPTPELKSRARPNWKGIVLNYLSGRNPWNPKYGAFSVIATSGKQRS